MRKRRLWITSQIMSDCWKEVHYYENKNSQEALDKVVHNLKIIALCKEYIMR